jgi:hypothetical protein
VKITGEKFSSAFAKERPICCDHSVTSADVRLASAIISVVLPASDRADLASPRRDCWSERNSPLTSVAPHPAVIRDSRLPFCGGKNRRVHNVRCSHFVAPDYVLRAESINFTHIETAKSSCGFAEMVLSVGRYFGHVELSSPIISSRRLCKRSPVFCAAVVALSSREDWTQIIITSDRQCQPPFATRCSKMIDVDDCLGKCLRSFLRKVVSDSARNSPVFILANEFLGI